MFKTKITIKRKIKRGTRDTTIDNDLLSPEKKRKIEELMLARQNRRLNQEDSKNPALTRDELAHKAGGEVGATLSKKDRLCRRIIDWGIVGLLVFSPLPAASVHAWSMLVIQLTVFVLVGVYLVMDEKPAIHPGLSSALRWPRYLFSALFVLILVQIAPWPSFMVKFFSPAAYSFRVLYSPAAGVPKFLGMSLIPSHSFREGLMLISYFLLGYLIIISVTRQRQIMRILYALIGMAVFQALYGFFELYSQNPRILFYKKEHYLDAVTGTFINRNHLSGYLEMIVPLALGLLMARTDVFTMSKLSWRERLLRFSGKGIYIRTLVPVSIIVISLAIIFSKSRSGIFLLVLAFLLTFEISVLYILRSGRTKIVVSRLLKIMFVCITLVALYIGIEGVIQRFSMEKILREFRPIFWSQTADIIKDFPALGTGLGTFGSVYPVYDRIMVPAQFSHAHNDYLEYASELGALGLVFLFGGIVLILAKSFLVWKKRRHLQIKGLALGGFIAVTLLLLHSITDFNLHIPANMLLFSVILSLTVVMTFHKKKEKELLSKRDSSDRGFNSSRPKDKTYIREIKEWQKFINQRKKSSPHRTIYLAILAVLILISIAIYWNHYLYSKGRKMENPSEKMKVLSRANRVYPLNDLIFYESGKANYEKGIHPSQFSEVRLIDLQNSVDDFEKSLRINLLSAYGHFGLGQSLHALRALLLRHLDKKQAADEAVSEGAYLKGLQDRALREFRKAVMLAGHRREIYFEVGKVYFANWHLLSDEDRDFTIDFLKKLSEHIEKDELLQLMHHWDLYVHDYAVMNAILPQDRSSYFLYAKYLGENSLSIDECHRYLAKAEMSRFEYIKKSFNAGESAFMYRRIKEATDHFNMCLRHLKIVKFYQNLSGQRMIDFDRFEEIRKNVYLMLAKCGLLAGRKFVTVEPNLRQYLNLEDQLAPLGELAEFLQNQGLIGDRLEVNPDNLILSHLHMFLKFKQKRYEEIIGVGHALYREKPIFPKSKSQAFASMMHIIGKAFFEEDHIYDAIDFFKKATDIDPKNLTILVSLKKGYERVNDNEGIAQVEQKIETLVMPEVKEFGHYLLKKGKGFSPAFRFDGEKIVLTLNFMVERDLVKPLISVCLNNRVIWEDYLKDTVLSISVSPVVGENELDVTPINRDVIIKSIAYRKNIGADILQ